MTIILMTKSKEIVISINAYKSNSEFTLSASSIHLFRTRNHNKRDKKTLITCLRTPLSNEKLTINTFTIQD